MTQPNLPEIYFIRHGETDWNAEGRYQGRRDIPLNATGQAQADANGPLLQQLLAAHGHDTAEMPWYVSPLSRTRETARRVRSAFESQLPEVTIEDRLAEVSFGKYEGYLLTELGAQGMPEAGKRTEAFWDFRPEEGESYADALLRLSPFFARIDRPSVVVAHGGIARVFRRFCEQRPIVEVVNWPVPQNVVMHFAQGEMHMHESGLPGRSF